MFNFNYIQSNGINQMLSDENFKQIIRIFMKIERQLSENCSFRKIRGIKDIIKNKKLN